MTHMDVPRTRRIGRFEVDAGAITHVPDLVRKIMHDCIVVRAEYRYDTDRMHYTALHPEFAEVPFGEAAPKYQAMLTKTDDGATTCTWEPA